MISSRQAAAPPPARAITGGPSVGASPVWLVLFVLLQIFCQVALLFETLARLRVIFRSAAFLMSLALLLFLPWTGRTHPARNAALVVMGAVTLAFFNPDTFSSFLAAMAQWAMYLAILGPIFWVNRLRIDSATITRLFLILWVFHSASAFVGVLQVYYPGQFQMALSGAIKTKGADYSDSLKVTLANGEMVYRPMGLTDQPGGAGSSGLSVILIALGLMLSSRSRWLRLAAILSMALGLFCIYLSMTRAAVVMGAICIVTTAAVLIRRGNLASGIKVLTTTAILAVASFIWAIAVGGQSIENRYATLIEERFDDVYQKNRGQFLSHTFGELLPLYPLGAGLGRWGMMNYYFGDPDASNREMLWVEIQWTGWLFDGGLPLMACYAFALLLVTWTAWRLANIPMQGALATWSVVLVARDVGALAIIFSYPFFISQAGMEYWLLNAAVYAAFSASRKPVRFVTAPRSGSQGERELPPPVSRLALNT